MKQTYFLAKNWLLRPAVRHTLSELADLHRLDEAALVALNTRRRAAILTHAFDTTSFYYEKYNAAGFKRADLEQPDILAQLPTVTRDDIRNRFDDMISSEVSSSRIGRSSTGGSTGIPLMVGTDPRLALEVISWRRLQIWGAEPSDNAGYIYRAIPRGSAALQRTLYHFPTRRSYLSATQMSDPEMAAFASRLISTSAKYLVSYVGALKIFAEFVEVNKIRFPALKFIWSTAAPLPRNLRMYLERVFGVPVYSQYGSCEFYWMAAERTDRTGLDVDWDIRHIEVLDANNQPVVDGVHGQLVVTDFINRAFPLIRYEIGDRSRFQPGSGKPGLPVLDYVSGRTSDTIELKNGMSISGEFWTTVFDDYADKIKSFSVHQTKDYLITVSFVPTENWTLRLENKLLAGLKKIARGTPVVLRQEAVDTYDRGKLSFVSSDIGKK